MLVKIYASSLQLLLFHSCFPVSFPKIFQNSYSGIHIRKTIYEKKVSPVIFDFEIVTIELD